MSYQPNLLLMDDLHRRIAMATKQFSQYTLLLRPTRRHIFLRMFRLPQYQQLKEFFSPCFGVLSKQNDPDKKPCMVIETDIIPEQMKQLYNQNGILWVSIRQEENQFVLECSHGGTNLRVEEHTGSLFKLLAAPLSWYEHNISFPQGSFVHSYSERILREAVQALSPSYRIECHHQVPVSYTLGYKNDLTPDDKRLLGLEIDAVVIQSLEADPDGAVILPIKLDIHDSHKADSTVIRRDDAVRQLLERYKVPLLTVSQDPDNTYAFDCPIFNLPATSAEEMSSGAWASALAPFLGRALQYAGHGF